jgi:D-amino-acid dehydrogenase
MRIAIIGAGITGLTSAFALTERGHSVTVFDQHRYAAMATSFANGGQLSVSNAEVWNSTATVLKGIAWMFKKNAPLSVSLKPSWRKYEWFARFLSEIPNYRKNTVKTVELALEARTELMRMATEADADFDLEKRGILHIYRERKLFDHAARVNELLKQGGLERMAVTAAEARTIEPTLDLDLYGGFYTPSDLSGDIHKFCRGLAKALVKRGAVLNFETSISDLRAANGGATLACKRTTPGAISEQANFDAVVICAGVASAHLGAMVGDRIPVYPVKGYSITVALENAAAQAAAPRVSLLDDATKIVASRFGNDRFRVAGTAEINGYNLDVRADRIEPLTRWIRDLFPGVPTDRITPWAGLRPMMPNMLPKVGAGKRAGIYYNTGHGHLGWTLSAATARLLAEKIDEDAAPRRLTRSTGGIRNLVAT